MSGHRKSLTHIEHYLPSPVPTLGNNNPLLTEYLNNEFRRLSYPLRTLSGNWHPGYQLGLHGASLPTALTSTVQTITNYTDSIESHDEISHNVVIDPVAGTFEFGSAASLQLLIKIDCSVVLDRLSGSNNTALLMHLNIDGATQIITSDFASNQVNYMSMYGGFMGTINGNALVSIGISYVGSATVSYVNSFFDLQVLGIMD